MMQTTSEKKVSNYDALLQDMDNSPKSIHMGRSQSKCFLGRQKNKGDEPKIRQKAERRFFFARLLDRISAYVHSPDFQLLAKCQHKKLTELCAQTMSPGGLEVLSGMFVLSNESKTEKPVSVTGSDSNSGSGEHTNFIHWRHTPRLECWRLTQHDGF